LSSKTGLGDENGATTQPQISLAECVQHFLVSTCKGVAVAVGDACRVGHSYVLQDGVVFAPTAADRLIVDSLARQAEMKQTQNPAVRETAFVPRRVK